MKPLAVAVGLVIEKGKVLLLKREKEPYKGYWCIPGGKIEPGEHPKQATLREIKEETGITCDYVKFNGIYTEVMRDQEEIVATFILFVSTLKPHHTNHVESEEGALKWFELNTITEHKDEIIPNDYMAVLKFGVEKDGIYYETDMNKKEDTYEMIRFEKIN